MGVAAPLIKYPFGATDNVLSLDETEHSTQDTTYVLKQTFNCFANMAFGTKFRIKVTMKNSIVGKEGSCQLREWNGVTETVLKTFTNVASAYQEQEDDLTPTLLTTGSAIRFYLKGNDAVQTFYLKNISVCGEICPYVY